MSPGRASRHLHLSDVTSLPRRLFFCFVRFAQTTTCNQQHFNCFNKRRYSVYSLPRKSNKNEFNYCNDNDGLVIHLDDPLVRQKKLKARDALERPTPGDIFTRRRDAFLINQRDDVLRNAVVAFIFAVWNLIGIDGASG